MVHLIYPRIPQRCIVHLQCDMFSIRSLYITCAALWVGLFGPIWQMDPIVLARYSRRDRKQSNDSLIDDDEFCSIALRSSPISKANSVIHLSNNCGTLSIPPQPFIYHFDWCDHFHKQSPPILPPTNGVFGTHLQAACAWMCARAYACVCAQACVCLHVIAEPLLRL